jgi:L-ascorbate metabolism protein UlaG (beta-lactamase superfamily)
MARKELILPAGNRSPDLRLGSIFFIGTATTLIRYAGFTILTDPNFLHQHEQVHLGYGLHATRLTNPALDIAELPPVDLIVLSHMHEDHFDRVAAEQLDHTLPIVTTRHAAKDLRRKGFTRTYSLKTWQTQTIVKGDVRLRITAMPGTHGPGILAALLPPVMGSMLQFESVATGRTLLQLYITGDTLVHKRLKEIPKRYPQIDLALLHLGGTRVMGLMVTMDGKQGVEVVQIVDPTIAIPIHYNDYTVFKSPLEDFKREVLAAGLEEKIRYLRHGETYSFEIPKGRRR